MNVYRFPIPTLFNSGLNFNGTLNSARASAGVRADVQRLMDDVFSPSTAGNSTRAFRAAVDAREDATGFTLDLDVPGIAPDAIEVLAEDGVLTIRGTPTARALSEGESALFSERATTAFERKFRLPKTADTGAIAASYANGVLTVRVAKLAPLQPKRVTVNVEAAR